MLYQTWVLPNGSLSDMGTIYGWLLIDDPCQTHIVFYNPAIIRPHLEFCNAEGLINPVAGALISYIKIFAGAHFLMFRNIMNASVTCDQVKIL